MLDWLKRRFTTSQRKGRVLLPRALATGTPAQAKVADDSIAHKKNGDAYFNRGQFAEAAACYRQAVICDPVYAEALNNLGNACRELGQFEDAERCLRRAAGIKPLANVHYNLASLLMEQGKLVEAIEYFDWELQRDPNHYAALGIKLHLMQKICAWDGLEANTIRLRQSLAAPYESGEAVFSPFAFIALPGTTPEEQKRCAAKWVRSEYQSLIDLGKTLAFSHRRPRNNKITLGYLSGNFCDHPLARLAAQMFELHNRDRFHVFGYSYGPDDGGEMRKRLISGFDKFVDFRNDSEMDCARRIYADQVDILVDLTGLTENNRSGILAMRPAPLQLSFLGYLGTMGADFVDYIIADNFIVPIENQKHYTEKLLYMPHCFQPNDSTRPRPAAPTRDACGLPGNGFVFCCFNQTYKITPAVFATWCRLLVSVPGSVLWLFAATSYAEENLKREAQIRGVDPARLVMAPKENVERYLARMHCADLFLDTTPYNAGTTCSDALWMGLPVVTCAGQTFSSRMAGSLLSAIGTPELITYNLEDYLHLALDLATNRHKLDVIRSRIIANRDTAPLFDSKRFTRSLENAYVALVEKHRHPKSQ